MTGVWQYGVLMPFMVTATVTDWRRRTIPNWLTYPGMVVGIVLNAVLAAQQGGDSTTSPSAAAWAGAVHGLQGFLLCGLLMLVCFVLFPIGGGDVKLIAMMGAFLGVDHGIEAMLWTFVLGAIIGVGALVWQVGLVELVGRGSRRLVEVVRTGGQLPMADEDREPLKQELFLAGAALLAVGIQVWRRGIV